MKHSRDDGRGPREVWLDGVLLDRVIECDDENATAVRVVAPFIILGGELATEELKGDCLVVRSISEYERISSLSI